MAYREGVSCEQRRPRGGAGLRTRAMGSRPRPPARVRVRLLRPKERVGATAMGKVLYSLYRPKTHRYG